MTRRDDDYPQRSAHLKQMDDEQLKAYFWQLAEQVVNPLLLLGRENTTPSIERSVLLRMGFSSIEVKPIVEGALAHNLLGHGAGHVVYKLAKAKGLPLREAGLALSRGECWNEAAALFEPRGGEVT